MRLYTATLVCRLDETADDPSPRLSVNVDVEDGVPSGLALAVLPAHLRQAADDVEEQVEDGDIETVER